MQQCVFVGHFGAASLPSQTPEAFLAPSMDSWLCLSPNTKGVCPRLLLCCCFARGFPLGLLSDTTHPSIARGRGLPTPPPPEPRSLPLLPSLRLYNSLVERCFCDCIDQFRRKDLDTTEEKVLAPPLAPPPASLAEIPHSAPQCVIRCAEKFLKTTARTSQRFAELTQAAEEQMAARGEQSPSPTGRWTRRKGLKTAREERRAMFLGPIRRCDS